MFLNNPTIYRKLLLLLTVLLGSGFAFGQQKKLFGKIENEKDVEGIHILNTSSHFNTVTDATGNFVITVQPKDTLLISSVTYVPEKRVVTEEIYENGHMYIRLQELVNELDEVFLGPRLSGNLEQDIKNIKTEDAINFDDVGIPGFKGTPQEKIPNLIGQVITPTAVNIEGLYKYLSGYYKTLRTKRKWQAQNRVVSQIINLYGDAFFEEAYQIPKERVYDFLLFCIETSSLKNDFTNGNFVLVLQVFSEKAQEYRERISEKKE
ncbi:MAG: carboxypeptidase-like regulatory domain-containing protein [Flavobacteriaceae bacterium]